MEPQRNKWPSIAHQQVQGNQSNAPLLGNNAMSIDAAGLNHNLGHSFENIRQASVDSTASFMSNNSTASSVVNNINLYDQEALSLPTQAQFTDPNFDRSKNFHRQFKQENYLDFSHTQQDLKRNLMDSTLQTLLQSDLPMISNTGNLDPFYPNENLSHNSLNLGQLSMNPSQNHSNISSNYLQPKSSPAHQSPNFGPSHFQSSPTHSRHNSIRTESAGLFNGRNFNELNLMQPQFQGHRRSPSEYSDVSTSSIQLSSDPRIHDISERLHSPMQHPQDCSLYQDVLGIGNFSLSETQAQRVHSPRSPAHSPDNSPQSNSRQNSLLGPYESGIQEMFTHSERIFPQESFPSLSNELGLALQMVPPEINVEFAPPSGQSNFDPVGLPPTDQGALIPPEKVRRRRAFTESTNGNLIIAPRSRSHSSVSSHSNRSLSPNHDLGLISPGRIRRQSTPSMPNRDYILSLADPEYQGTAEAGNTRRIKKQYPATFQCPLCTKKFTRAYNLRSHLRTHTDERPFTCSVCNKAFARQHDRKRHEGLHSGERRFICKGELKPSGEWGCGRRFARADALGRHFRSEAGRICIHPLLEEEARERQRAWNEQQIQSEQQIHSMYNMQTPLQLDPNSYSSNFILPAALLAQYPALATLSWSTLPQGDVSKEDEPRGRSSFDASGSEYYDEGDESGYISSGPTSQQYV